MRMGVSARGIISEKKGFEGGGQGEVIDMAKEENGPENGSLKD